jgi:hypothetical protein
LKLKKIRKGYSEAQIVEADRPITVTLQPEDLKEIAAKQIDRAEAES